MKSTVKDYRKIKGWAKDADPKNEPTYPIKHYTGADHDRLHYKRPEQQLVDIEVLKSIERPVITTVFGTSTPPSGLSGVLRRFAFKYSEGSGVHWMTLVLADRINMIEGIIDDLSHGYIPNFFKERGWNAEWKYNRNGMIRNIAMWTGGLASAFGLYMLLKNYRRSNLIVR